jgi:hypothetical protein
MFFFVSDTRRIADWSKLVEIKISCEECPGRTSNGYEIIVICETDIP